MLPAGTWVFTGDAWLSGSSEGGTSVAGATCELHADSTSKVLIHVDTFFTGTLFQAPGTAGSFTEWIGDTTLSFNTTYAVPAGGDTVSLWCSVHGPFQGWVEQAQVTGIQTGPLI
jgi:hypothetical protein